MKRTSGIAVVCLALACTPQEDALPEPYGEWGGEPCIMPIAPSGTATALVRGKDPSHCLPPAVAERGLDVEVAVSAEGRAIVVSPSSTIYLCGPFGPDGMLVPRYELDDEAARCILKDLQDWRFAGVYGCGRQTAELTLGGPEDAPEPRTETARASVASDGGCS
jgi:hypothetical protein